MSDSHQIRVDHREHAAELLAALREKHGFNVEMVQLELGDYEMAPDILVERKTTRDFCLSLIDGRLFDQAFRLVEHHYNSILLVEGMTFRTDLSVDMACVRGAFITLAQTFRLPVLRTRDQADSAWTLAHLHVQRERLGRSRGVLKSSRRRTLARKREVLLRSLPGIGPKLAGLLLQHFGSIEAVIQAPEEELLAVPGMGKIKAKALREVVAESAGAWHLDNGASFLDELPPPEWPLETI